MSIISLKGGTGWDCSCHAPYRPTRVDTLIVERDVQTQKIRCERDLRYVHLIIRNEEDNSNGLVKDACHTDLFCEAWFCPNCGTEICGECRADIFQDNDVVSFMRGAAQFIAYGISIEQTLAEWCLMLRPQHGG